MRLDGDLVLVTRSSYCWLSTEGLLAYVAQHGGLGWLVTSHESTDFAREFSSD